MQRRSISAPRLSVVLCCGNVHRVSQVDDLMTVSEPADESTYYTVARGDTLSAIAKAQHGNANACMKIFEANKPMLSNPDKICPGAVSLRLRRYAVVTTSAG